MRQPRKATRRAARQARRGSALVFVLTATMLVATASIATLTIQRTQMRARQAASEAQEADQRALGILQLGGLVLRKDPYGVLYRPSSSVRDTGQFATPDRARRCMFVTFFNDPNTWLKIEAIDDERPVRGAPAPASSVRVTASAVVGQAERTYSFVARPVVRSVRHADWRNSTLPPTDAGFGAEQPALLRHGLVAGGNIIVDGRALSASDLAALRGTTYSETAGLAVAPRDNNAANSFYSQVPLVVSKVSTQAMTSFEACIPPSTDQPQTWEELAEAFALTDKYSEQMMSPSEPMLFGGSAQIPPGGAAGGLPTFGSSTGWGSSTSWTYPALGKGLLPGMHLLDALSGGIFAGDPPVADQFELDTTQTGSTAATHRTRVHALPILLADASGPGASSSDPVRGEIGSDDGSLPAGQIRNLLFWNRVSLVDENDVNRFPCVATLVPAQDGDPITLAMFRSKACVVTRGDAVLAGPVSMDPPQAEPGATMLPTFVVGGDLIVTDRADGSDLRERDAADMFPGEFDDGLNQLTSHFGAVDDDTDDSFPSRLRGVVYVMGNLVLEERSTLIVEGVLLVAGNVTIRGTSSSRAQLTVRYQPPVAPVFGMEEIVDIQMISGSIVPANRLDALAN